MGRLPFDPGRYQKPKEPQTLTVSQVAGRIAQTVRTHHGDAIRVIGQVSGFRDRTHWYFDLKDADAVLSCVMWQSAARRLAFTPEDGQEVVITATLDFYAKQGRLSLIVTRVEPVGRGALEIAYQALCNELRSLGWFDAERKRPIPTFPRRVGVITSRSSAALQDVIDTMRRRCPSVELALIDARVQGDGAADEVARAIRWAGRHASAHGLDALLITRGGGSMEDLWCFNERMVADAIVRCEIPVVAAIGHETDTTIAELVADARAATPTQAAMLLSPDVAALTEQLDAAQSRLTSRLAYTLERARRQVESHASRPCLADPSRVLTAWRDRLSGAERAVASTTRTSIAEQRVRLESVSARLQRHRPVALLARRDAALRIAHARLEQAMHAHCQTAASNVRMLDRELRAVGPLSVLERGFSCTTSRSGGLVRSIKDVAPGDVLTTRVADGAFSSRVEGAARPKQPKRPSPDQMDLFGASPYPSGSWPNDPPSPTSPG